MEKSDLFSNDFRQIDEGRVEGFDFATDEIFEKTAEGDEMIGLSDDLEIFTAVFGAVAVEP